jgi:hypothetical protein
LVEIGIPSGHRFSKEPVMRGNVVVAAVVFAAGMVVASLVLVLGIRLVADSALQRLDGSIQAHGQRVERSGVAAGVPIHDALSGLTVAMDKTAGSIQRAGDVISRPVVAVKGPVDVAQPIRIEARSPPPRRSRCRAAARTARCR